ncbi:elongation factor P 5-aminopentanone reductase [Salimicrobium flavidum]|uniref:3-oxoacyl-[acyl-carrier protein] reductase n=1 Tax=Salimicrobium flavidum TaxID=570947 RepID=A0A1N7IK24_9BACI|nr:SDR family oxidoreductase [Salimicrobium flavidum]SIS37443.1 3-oxoacyl-[acyl-carrier protein] reductase [Salimicrobium flavidum]
MKKCLVIGGSGDIGQAICRKLLDDGWTVGVHYHSSPPTLELPSSSFTIQGDLSNSEGIELFLEKLSPDWDGVVFAAGSAFRGLFQDSGEKEMDLLYNIHVKSMWRITSYIIPSMITKKCGSILVVTSIWGETGASTEVLYSSVKGAQRTFISALAKEVGPSGVRVNGVAPGMIDTKMNQDFSEEDLHTIEQEIPLHRQGKASEVADVCSFLLGERSSYITGEIINVSGGWK